MLGKACVNMLRTAARPVWPALTPQRGFAQVGMVVSTPARVPCSLGEKLLHALFMITVWTTPIAWFETQLKVWRREYVSP